MNVRQQVQHGADNVASALINRAPVDQTVDSAHYQRINLYPVDHSAIDSPNTYPLDEIYPMDSSIQLLNSWGQMACKLHKRSISYKIISSTKIVGLILAMKPI